MTDSSSPDIPEQLMHPVQAGLLIKILTQGEASATRIIDARTLEMVPGVRKAVITIEAGEPVKAVLTRFKKDQAKYDEEAVVTEIDGWIAERDVTVE